MSPDQINAAIAKALGWQWVEIAGVASLERPEATWYKRDELKAKIVASPSCPQVADASGVPDFAGSLDAMALAEATLTETEMLIYVETAMLVRLKAHRGQCHAIAARRGKRGAELRATRGG